MAVVFDYSSVKNEDVVEEGAVGVKFRWLIDRRLGVDKFAMRMFEFQPGGRSPDIRSPKREDGKGLHIQACQSRRVQS